MAVKTEIYKWLHKKGERRIIRFLFAISVILHSIYALQMEMMSIDPNEFGVAAWTAFFTGKNWSGVMSHIPYYYGFIGSLVYVPFMIFIKDPFIQYKAMLILNGIIVSFVPVFAYRLSVRIGVRRGWQRISVAAVCGLYSTVFAHTKFIWNEISCIIFPWLIIFLLIKTGDANGRTSKHLMSVLTAIILSISYFSHPRLISVIAGSIITLIYARIYMKKKLVFFSSFFSVFILASFALKLLSEYLMNVMWSQQTTLLQNTVDGYFEFLPQLKTPDGLALLFQTISGHLYYFSTSTWGLGVVAVCLVILVQYKYLKSRPNGKCGYGDYFVILSLYGFLVNLFAIIISALSKFSDSGFGQNQDTLIYGRYMDSVIPLLIMFVICYAFLARLDLPKLLASTVMMGVIYGFFFSLTAPVIASSTKTRVSPILGIYPIRIGERIDAAINFEGLFLTVSCVLSFTALIIVVVCCTEKHRKFILSGLMITIMLYSSLYTATVYLPFAANDAREVNAPIYQINDYIYNSADAPPVFVYNLPRRTSTLLQYLNQEAIFTATENRSDIPEHCFIIVQNKDRLAPRPGSKQILEELGKTEDYTVYAYGERAVAFAQSQTKES